MATIFEGETLLNVEKAKRAITEQITGQTSTSTSSTVDTSGYSATTIARYNSLSGLASAIRAYELTGHYPSAFMAVSKYYDRETGTIIMPGEETTPSEPAVEPTSSIFSGINLLNTQKTGDAITETLIEKEVIKPLTSEPVTPSISQPTPTPEPSETIFTGINLLNQQKLGEAITEQVEINIPSEPVINLPLVDTGVQVINKSIMGDLLTQSITSGMPIAEAFGETIPLEVKMRTMLGEQNYSAIQNLIPSTFAKEEFGYFPDTGFYKQVLGDINEKIQDAFLGYLEVKKFLYEYPEYQKQYEEAYNLISSTPNAPPGSFYWFDLNMNQVVDENEKFMEPMFKFGVDSTLFTRERALDKIMSDWESITSQYDIWSQGQANVLKYDILELKRSEAIIKEFQSEGYKIAETAEGYAFTQPSAKEIHDYLYSNIPGGYSQIRLGAIAGSEWFPTIIPIRAIISGVSTFITGEQKYWDEYMNTIYEKSVLFESKKRELSTPEFMGWYWNPFSESGVGVNVYLPLATAGLGALYSGLSVGGTIQGGGKVVSSLAKYGTTESGYLLRTAMKTGLYTATAWGIGLTGISIGTTALNNPEQLPGVIGEIAHGWASAMGGWMLGTTLMRGGIPKLSIDKNGRLKLESKTIYEDLMYNTEQGLEFHRLATTETLALGEKPGTGITYRTITDLFGSAKMIGEQTVISDIEGLSVRGGSNIFGKTYTNAEILKLISSGELNLVEGYGLSTKIGQMGSMQLTVDKTVSALLGKTPTVTESYGYSAFMELGSITKTIPFSETYLDLFENAVFGSKTITSNVEAMIARQFGVSTGIFENTIAKGVYTDIGFSFKLEGLQSFRSEVFAGGTGESMMLSSIGLQQLMGEKIFTGTISGKGTVQSPIVQGWLDTAGVVSSSALLSIKNVTPSVIKINDLLGAKGVITVSPRVTPVRGQEIGIGSINGTVLGNEQVYLTKSLLELESININIPEIEIGTILESETELFRKGLNLPVIGEILGEDVKQIAYVIPSVASDTFSEIISESEVEQPSVDITTPEFTPPSITPFTPFPFLPILGQGGDWGIGARWGKKKRYRESKIIDPFADLMIDFDIDFINGVVKQKKRKKKKK